ncbi:MAG: hypothetical protein ACKVX7_07860 [Planctomycetota bacterium]
MLMHATIGAALLLLAIALALGLPASSPSPTRAERERAAAASPSLDASSPERPTPVTLDSLAAIRAAVDTASANELVEALLQRDEPDALNLRVEIYQRLAGRANCETERRRLLASLDRLRHIVSAVGDDGMQPADDPHWDYAIDRVAEVVRRSDVTAPARDLLLTSPSHKGQRLLTAAFTRLGAAGHLRDADRIAMASDFTDLLFQTIDIALHIDLEHGLAVLGGDALAVALTSTSAGAEDLQEARERERAARELAPPSATGQ